MWHRRADFPVWAAAAAAASDVAAVAAASVAAAAVAAVPTMATRRHTTSDLPDFTPHFHSQLAG